MLIDCKHAACSGCAWIDRPYAQQTEAKREALKSSWAEFSTPPPIEVLTVAPAGLRDRVDLMIDQRSGEYRIGLLSRDRETVTDIESCPALSPALQSWLEKFRELRFDVSRGSIRLRVSPSGQRGCWLDFANIDIKKLLDEETSLRKLLSLAVVEIGQRRKLLTEKDGGLKLGEPMLKPWFETYVGEDLRAVPLYCSVASFTQPGFSANKKLVAAALQIVRAKKPRRIVEFGAGIGNFTLPLAALADHVDTFEIDRPACEGLSRALEEQNLLKKVSLHTGDFQSRKKIHEIDFATADMIFVDPPRSGLKHFLDPLLSLTKDKTKSILYISCFPESLVSDAKRLLAAGHSTTSMTIVDQFPQTPHSEVIALFEHS